MNSRERLTAALRGHPVDRLAWSPIIDGYYTSSLPAQGYNFDELACSRYIGADLLLRHVPYFKTIRQNVEYRVERAGAEELRSLETPVGSLSCKFHYSGNSCFSAESWIETLEDIKVFQYIAEHTTYQPDWQTYNDMDAKIGEFGMASASAPDTPLMTVLKNYCKLDRFAYLIDDYPEEMEMMLAALGESDLGLFEICAAAPATAEAFFAYENTSTTMLSPRWFNKYCAPYINKYADMLHATDKIYITHMCGKLSGLIKQIGACRQDGIDSICPPQSGDLWVCDALAAMPEKIMIGGLEPVALATMTLAETKTYVRKVILDSWKMRDRLIVSTGDATAYGTPIENMRAVSEVISEFY